MIIGNILIDSKTNPNVFEMESKNREILRIVLRRALTIPMHRSCSRIDWGLRVKHGVISRVHPATPASDADVKTGYGILSINGQNVLNMTDKKLAAVLNAEVYFI